MAPGTDSGVTVHVQFSMLGCISPVSKDPIINWTTRQCMLIILSLNTWQQGCGNVMHFLINIPLCRVWKHPAFDRTLHHVSGYGNVLHFIVFCILSRMLSCSTASLQNKCWLIDELSFLVKWNWACLTDELSFLAKWNWAWWTSVELAAAKLGPPSHVCPAKLTWRVPNPRKRAII